MVGRSRAARQWMYNRFDENTRNFTEEFVAGVDEFMSWVNSQPFTQSNLGKCFCPCDGCKNDKLLSARKVVSHLYRRGFMPEYYVWFMHGEEFNVDVGSSSHVPGYSQPVMHYDQDDRYVEMVNNAFPYQNTGVDDHFDPQEGYQCQDDTSVPEEPNVEAQRFYAMLDAANNPLYDGCRDGHSQLSLASRLMHIKTEFNLSERCMDAMTSMISEYLPAGNNCPASWYETEKLMRNLSLPYHAIDVCVNNCMIFWKEDERFEQCRFCGKDRYHQRSDGKTRIPRSRMWYMPVADRIKRLYQSPHTAEAMRWHAEHDSAEGELSHPSDGAEWKNFNLQHPTFASEKRNVYLGLCTDGFNPFGMQKNHSLWPIILTPYNLPPGMCMKEEYLWLAILNSGPSHPRASLDIFLRPLIDELKELWNSGVEMYDVSQGQNFNCRVALMWTISDFPAYGMLSGWTTHGRLSCPICMDDIDAFHLPAGRKTSWFDCHRRFLPPNHALRRNKRNFRRGKHAVNQDPPLDLSGYEVLYERVRAVGPKKTSECGGNGHDHKEEGYGHIHNWHKESIFWELPYWEDLNLRHNLDVMHIEKNFFDNIIHTIMNVKEKSKDNVKARMDLVQFCSRKELHLDSRGVAPVPIFRLSATAKHRLLQCVKHDVQFPDGYAADLATCADIEAGKFVGMKSHDCHVFMQRLFPFIFAELLPKNVHLAISGIGGFFRDLCSRTLQQGTIDILKDNIVLILCNLEKIFPPAFFDVMEHLPIHLPREAELGGPVQYRWMYPFERFFKKLKSKAKNKRYAAGSIVQSYLKDEISFFSEQYFASHIQTKNNTTRFADGEAPVYPVPVPDMFTHIGRPSGKKTDIWLSEKDYNCAHAYILRNCEWFRNFESMFENQIRRGFPHLSDDEVYSKKDAEFPSWMQNLVKHNPTLPGGRAWPIWVKELVEGPSRQVSTWPMYITRGYLFHTRKYGQGRKTCNYGVCVRGSNYSDQADEDDFHGVLTDIIEVEYGGLVNLKLTLFKCDWYDPTPGRGTRRNSSGGVDVMSTGKYNTYEPFILASQADQVCYIRYPHVKQPRIQWLNVCKVNPRGNITGSGKNELLLLQQDVVEGSIVSPFEDLAIENLASTSEPPEPIAYEVNDSEPEDEFRGNMSSSDEDEDEENDA